MEVPQRPKPTPVMILKIIGLSICMPLGFGFAFYAGYNSLSYLLPPIIFLEVACSPCFVLINRYLKSRMYQADQLNNIRGSFYMGCVVFFLSVSASLFYAITGLGHVGDFHYEKYGEYIALGASLLATFWSAVLVYDARYFWKTWQRVVGTQPAYGGPQMFMRP